MRLGPAAQHLLMTLLKERKWMRTTTDLVRTDKMDVFVPAGGRMWTTEQSMLGRRSTGVTIKLFVYCFSLTSNLWATGQTCSPLIFSLFPPSINFPHCLTNQPRSLYKGCIYLSWRLTSSAPIRRSKHTNAQYVCVHSIIFCILRETTHSHKHGTLNRS